MTKMLEEIHPGEILLEEFMKPKGITARQVAADIDVPPSRISDIVNGRRPITADTALRLVCHPGRSRLHPARSFTLWEHDGQLLPHSRHRTRPCAVHGVDSHRRNTG